MRYEQVTGNRGEGRDMEARDGRDKTATAGRRFTKIRT